jgi:hypothetical protein
MDLNNSSDEEDSAAPMALDAVPSPPSALQFSPTEAGAAVGEHSGVAVAAEEEEEEEEVNVEATSVAGVEYTAAAAAEGETTAEGPAAAVVEFAEGLRLHLSSRSSTGYRGVYYKPSNAKDRKYFAQLMEGSRFVSLGHYATALEAAVAYAKHVGEAGAEQPGSRPRAPTVRASKAVTSGATTSADDEILPFKRARTSTQRYEVWRNRPCASSTARIRTDWLRRPSHSHQAPLRPCDPAGALDKFCMLCVRRWSIIHGGGKCS